MGPKEKHNRSLQAFLNDAWSQQKSSFQEQQWGPDDLDPVSKQEACVSEWNLNSYDPETRPQDSTEYSMLCINRMSYCKIYQSTT